MPYELVPQTDYLSVKIKGVLKGDEKPDLVAAFVDHHSRNQVRFVVIDAQDCTDISSDSLRDLALIYKHLKATGGMIRLIGAPRSVEAAVKSAGLDRILVMRESLRGAMVDFGLVNSKEFDVNFLNPFLVATRKVFEIQCQVKVQPGKPFLKKSGDNKLLGDVSGVIGVQSETFNGTLAISLGESIYVQIASKMLGEQYKVIDEGNVDLIGELANIILGQAKIDLGKLGYGVRLALPACVWGQDHQTQSYGQGGVCVVIPFECEFGVFHIEVMTQAVNATQTSTQAPAAKSA